MSKSYNIVKFIDSLNKKLCMFSGWLCLALVLLTVEQVLARYIFDAPSNSLEELKWHIFGTIFLLAGAHTLKADAHVRVDIFYQNFSKRKQLLIDSLGIIFFLIPASLFIFIYGIDFSITAYKIPNPRPDDYYTMAIVKDTEGFLYSILASIEGFLRLFILRGEVSSNQGGLDARWLIKAIIPVGFLQYILQGISMLIRNIIFLSSHKNLDHEF